MPIKSYLAFVDPDRFVPLCDQLAAYPWADVHPAENRPLLVVVTDTADAEEERRAGAILESLDGIQCLALVHGHAMEEPLIC